MGKIVNGLVGGEAYLLKETEEFCSLVGTDGRVFDFSGQVVQGVFIGTVKLVTGMRNIFWIGAVGGYAMFGTKDLSYVVE